MRKLYFSLALVLTLTNAQGAQAAADGSSAPAAQGQDGLRPAIPQSSTAGEPNFLDEQGVANQKLRPPNSLSGQGNISNTQPAYSSTQDYNNHGPRHTLLHAVGDTASGVGHAAFTLLTATMGNTDIDLPADTADNLGWPFNERRKKTLFTVYFANGTEGVITRSPDGVYNIIGPGKRMTLQPLQGDSYALMGEDGTMATITPRLDGGYTIMGADGTSQSVVPRQGGGYTVTDAHGVKATIIPGSDGSKHVIGRGKYSRLF